MKAAFDQTFLETYFPKVISEIEGFAVFMLEIDGTIATWNEGCIQVKGYQPEEAIGRNYQMLFPDFLKEKGMPEIELKESAETGRYQTDNWRRRKSGELFWAHVVMTKVTDKAGAHIGFCKIVQDYSEMKKFEMELKQKNEMLSEVNKDLDNFVYTASHDLKGPISNLEGLISHLNCDSSQNEVIALIKHSLENLKTVVSEMAVVGRTQAEEIQISRQSFKEILEEIKIGLNDEITVSQAQIKDNFLEPLINFPKKNLRSVMYNLLSNALKYRSPDRTPAITISSKSEDDYIILTVSDNGVGIRESDKRKVFSLYQRLDNNAPYIEGTGVGMAIVARIVDSSKGRIELESELGEGATFKIFLRT